VMLAKVMLQQDLYGQARSYLEMALRLGEGKDLYLTFAELEKEQYNDLDASQIWTRKALGCSASSCWVCKITGTHYQNWSLFVGHEMNFYSLKWCDDKNGFNDAPDISLHENADLNHFEMADAINPVFETPKTLKAL
jgi:hypothetical protein